MINEKDLQIGNWVMLEGKSYRITTAKEIGELSSSALAIPIFFPEILECCGFVRRSQFVYENDDFIWNDGQMFLKAGSMDEVEIDIEYLHQFQNSEPDIQVSLERLDKKVLAVIAREAEEMSRREKMLME